MTAQTVINIGDWPSWIQAIGSLGAIGVVIFIWNRDRRTRDRAAQLEAQGIATAVFPEILYLNFRLPVLIKLAEAAGRLLESRRNVPVTQASRADVADAIGQLRISGLDQLSEAAKRCHLLGADAGPKAAALIGVIGHYNRVIDEALAGVRVVTNPAASIADSQKLLRMIETLHSLIGMIEPTGKAVAAQLGPEFADFIKQQQVAAENAARLGR